MPASPGCNSTGSPRDGLMALFLLAYLGGVLTILSPCILPVLPFVFARADRPFVKSGLPLLVGMAVSFAAIASLATIGGGWAVDANRIGRAIALVLFAGFALLLIFPGLADRAMQPLVRMGERLSGPGRNEGIGGSLVLGLATGLLWAPCAGPILGLILTGAALSGASASTVLLLLAYALGAATSLALALLVGGKVFAAMKRSLGAGQWVRRALGVLVLGAVVVIALGLDTRVLTSLSAGQTNAIETRLARTLGMADDMPKTSVGLKDEGPLPSLDGAVTWLNSPALTAEQLKGKVVLVDFWTYSCINCIRTIPHVKALYDRYAKDGLVIIGVHSPEFAFEKDLGNVRKAVGDFGIRYPVAIDNGWTIWRAFSNRYWPAQYLADAKGRIRYHHFGEGGEASTEGAIRTLLAEADGQRCAGRRARPHEAEPEPQRGERADVHLERSAAHERREREDHERHARVEHRARARVQALHDHQLREEARRGEHDEADAGVADRLGRVEAERVLEEEGERDRHRRAHRLQRRRDAEERQHAAVE